MIDIGFNYRLLGGRNWNGSTPLKINMEPKNHRIEKDNHLPNLHFAVPNVNFQGCIHFYAFLCRA